MHSWLDHESLLVLDRLLIWPMKIHHSCMSLVDEDPDLLWGSSDTDWRYTHTRSSTWTRTHREHRAHTHTHTNQPPECTHDWLKNDEFMSLLWIKTEESVIGSDFCINLFYIWCLYKAHVFFTLTILIHSYTCFVLSACIHTVNGVSVSQQRNFSLYTSDNTSKCSVYTHG